jgi:aspartyl-tRNA(Asn)/glutamyl-tRNA(Gln) amidotransferase subunit B
VRKGLEHEEKRQAEVILAGGVIEQETRRFDEATGSTILMRVKEGSDDYRYFPEPDLPDLYIDEEWKARIRAEIPELPDQRIKRYVEELGLPHYDAQVLTITKQMSDFFDATVLAGADAKQASNWIMGDVSAYLNSEQKELDHVALTPESLAGLLKLIEDGTISTKIAKTVFKELIETGGNPEQIVKAKGLVQISDEGALIKVITEVLDANPQSIDDYKNGKQKAVGFLVGQLMKATKGQANPQLVNKLLLEEINKR